MPAKVVLCPVVRAAIGGSHRVARVQNHHGRYNMRISRRTILKGAAALPLAAGNPGFAALAQPAPSVPAASEIPPILFVHGNGDHAALWLTTLWRVESTRGSRAPTLCITFPHPLTRPP